MIKFYSQLCKDLKGLSLMLTHAKRFHFKSQELLSYKSYNSSLQDDKVSVHFDLHWSKSFSKPIFAIETVDLTNNGLRELAVVSLNGVHILQVSCLTIPQYLH